MVDNNEQLAIGYATSQDGINWRKYRKNPLYGIDNDHFAYIMGTHSTVLEFPSLVSTDTTCFMFYDYGTLVGKIGLAKAPVH